MAISQKRYVDITSGVGGQAAASERELILRLITTNRLVPFGSILEFSSLDDVGNYFGVSTASAPITEYDYAQKYFGYVSKDITTPKKISFARWAQTALAPQIISTITPASVAQFQALESPDITLTINGTEYSSIEMDFSEATSLADIADAIENAIRQPDPTDPVVGSATVTANTIAGKTRFIFTAGNAEAATIEGATGNLAQLLGWNVDSNPILSNGAAAEEPAGAMARIAELSDNFGSFLFTETLTTAQIGAVAAWNASAEQNVKYMYLVPVSREAANVTEVTNAVTGMNGTWVQLTTSGGYEEYMPGAILAATNYRRTNATRNYMYQQFPGATAVVTTNADANVYDNMRVNFYGATQTSGRQLAFLQRGVLQGSISDAGVYANEMWLKDSFLTAFFNLFLALNKIPAGAEGEKMVRGVMLATINQAIDNGTILPSKEFTTTQKAYIDNLTGREGSWFEAFNNGWTLDVKTETAEEYGSTLYKIVYVLIYSKGDSIKKVEGTDILI